MYLFAAFYVIIKWIFFTGNISIGTFPDLVKFTQGHFQELENEFQVFQDAWESRMKWKYRVFWHANNNNNGRNGS